jgi:hypothetical protein
MMAYFFADAGIITTGTMTKVWQQVVYPERRTFFQTMVFLVLIWLRSQPFWLRLADRLSHAS